MNIIDAYVVGMFGLQECCNSPFGNEYFADYAEAIPGESTEAYSQAAKDNSVFLVAGTCTGGTYGGAVV